MAATRKKSDNDPVLHALAAVDIASLGHYYVTEMHRIFSALVLLTAGSEEANGLAQVGNNLGELYETRLLNETEILQKSLNALKGGAQ